MHFLPEPCAYASQTASSPNRNHADSYSSSTIFKLLGLAYECPVLLFDAISVASGHPNGDYYAGEDPMHMHLCTCTYAHAPMHMHLCTCTYAHAPMHPMQMLHRRGRHRPVVVGNAGLSHHLFLFFCTPRGDHDHLQRLLHVNGVQPGPHQTRLGA